MTRPRHETIDLTASPNELFENVSRRRLVRLAGVSGASFIAGCGGGGEETPTPTATEPAGREAPTATEHSETPTSTETEGRGTPTPTETEEPATPSGRRIEFIDRDYRTVQQANLETATVNPWNSENAFQPALMTTPLSVISSTMTAPADVQEAESMVFPGVAKSTELDLENNRLTIELQSDPPVTFGDGTVCDVDHVFAHWDLVRGRIEMGESSESTLPISWEATGEFSFTSTLLPGNALIRLLTAFFQGDLIQIPSTHPELHAEYIERVRDATTTAALQDIYRDLLSARFGLDELPTMTNSAFLPTDWNPNRILFEAREDYPWGLGTGLEIDRMFGGIRFTPTATTTQGRTQVLNASVNNLNDAITLESERVFDRFPDNWERWEVTDDASTSLWYQPTGTWGKKTEKARNLRKATTSLFDNAELAAINDQTPAYEQSMSFSHEEHFVKWLGEVRDQYEDYGNADSGYVKRQKGNQYFRDAGYERNKNGFWADGDGVLTAEVYLGTDTEGGTTEPVLRNVPEQLNRMGIDATGRLVGGEQFDTATTQRSGDMIFSSGNCEIFPHPYFGYREDCGLGSTEGLPVGLWWGDWHNGYRRVQVPFPVGSVDGSLGTYDWDRNVLQIAELPAEDIKPRIEELNWVMNQWNPGIFSIATTATIAVNTDRVRPTAAWSDPTQLGKPEGLYEAGGVWWPWMTFGETRIPYLLAMGLFEPA